MAQASDDGRAGEQWNTRLPPDVNSDVSKFRERRDLTKSEAARRLMQAGLQQRSTTQQWAHDIKQLADHMASLGIVAFVATAFWPAGGILPAFTLGLTFATVAASSYLLSYYVKVNY